jgi:hypothetical protein
MSTTMLQHETADAIDIEIERGAFNAAFYELGLRWHWDSGTYVALAANPCERDRVKRYLESEQSHLLRAYDAEFLTEAILTAKRRCRHAFAASASCAMPRFSWTDPRWGEVGI